MLSKRASYLEQTELNIKTLFWVQFGKIILKHNEPNFLELLSNCIPTITYDL